MIISVVQLGRIDYATGLRLQETLVNLRKKEEIPNVLLLLEHTPVITLGRNAQRKNVLASDEFLRDRSVELFECNRGGDVTFHGPGQLVGYPIFDLRSFTDEKGNRKTMYPVEFVRRMEETLIRTCLDYGVATERVSGMTGVWTKPTLAKPATVGHPEQGKIAAIGVHISRGVTSHGFALNVTNEPLEYFPLIVPCGIASKPVTSLEKELGVAPDVDDLAQRLSGHFGRVFNSQIVWVDTLDALLGHVVGVPVRAPEELRKLGDNEKFWA
ncbi:MAG: lipoyl(octanoyl) transferase LipB [Terriglobales bacterium]